MSGADRAPRAFRSVERPHESSCPSSVTARSRASARAARIRGRTVLRARQRSREASTRTRRGAPGGSLRSVFAAGDRVIKPPSPLKGVCTPDFGSQACGPRGVNDDAAADWGAGYPQLRLRGRAARARASAKLQRANLSVNAAEAIEDENADLIAAAGRRAACLRAAGTRRGRGVDPHHRAVGARGVISPCVITDQYRPGNR